MKTELVLIDAPDSVTMHGISDSYRHIDVSGVRCLFLRRRAVKQISQGAMSYI
jgi:hypothetical protein